MGAAGYDDHFGRDGARRSAAQQSVVRAHVLEHSFSSLNAGWDSAVRRPYYVLPGSTIFWIFELATINIFRHQQTLI
jgi:hypothetical protein